MTGLLVTGTDTGVGKTRVTAAIARCLKECGHHVGALKPVSTGCAVEPGLAAAGDAALLLEALGGGIARELVAPLCFREPLAPSVAARIEEGAPLDMNRVVESTRSAISAWATRADILLVEGVGGFLCPLAEGTTFADLAVELDYPVLIVARSGLGTLNHTLLTVEAVSLRGLRTAGVLLNETDRSADPEIQKHNFAELSRRLRGIPVLALVPHLVDPATLCQEIRDVDWYERAQQPRWHRV